MKQENNMIKNFIEKKYGQFLIQYLEMFFGFLILFVGFEALKISIILDEPTHKLIMLALSLLILERGVQEIFHNF